MRAVYVRGVSLVAKHVVPLMRGVEGASIVNMSSVSAFIAASGGVAYHAPRARLSVCRTSSR